MLVITGLPGTVGATVRVRVCVALGSTPFAAVTESGYVPIVPAAGVPEITPVPALKAKPEGSVPVTDTVGAGDPVVVIANAPFVSSANVAVLALVIAGAAG